MVIRLAWTVGSCGVRRCALKRRLDILLLRVNVSKVFHLLAEYHPEVVSFQWVRPPNVRFTQVIANR